MAAFDDILDDMKVPAEDRELSLTAFLTKHPEVHDSVIRRKEYNRKLDEMADDRKELGEWRKQKDLWDPEQGKWKFQIKLETDLEAANRKAQELQAALEAGGDMNFDEVLTGLKDKGVVLKGDIPALVTETVTKGANGKPIWDDDVEKRQRFQSAGFEYIFAKATPLVTRYAKEFDGAEMPMGDFVTFCNSRDKGWDDVDASYKLFTEGKRSQLEVEALKKRAEDAEAKAKELAEKSQHRSQPDDTGGNTPQALGPLARRMAETRKAANGESHSGSDGKLGDGSAAASGLKRLQEGTLVTAEP